MCISNSGYFYQTLWETILYLIYAGHSKTEVNRYEENANQCVSHDGGDDRPAVHRVEHVNLGRNSDYCDGWHKAYHDRQRHRQGMHPTITEEHLVRSLLTTSSERDEDPDRSGQGEHDTEDDIVSDAEMGWRHVHDRSRFVLRALWSDLIRSERFCELDLSVNAYREGNRPILSYDVK